MWKCKQPAAAAHRSHPQRRGSGGIYIYIGRAGARRTDRAARPDPCPPVSGRSAAPQAGTQPHRPERWPQIPTNRSAPSRRRPAARRAVSSAVASHRRLPPPLRARGAGAGCGARLGAGLCCPASARGSVFGPRAAVPHHIMSSRATGPGHWAACATAADDRCRRAVVSTPLRFGASSDTSRDTFTGILFGGYRGGGHSIRCGRGREHSGGRLSYSS